MCLLRHHRLPKFPLTRWSDSCLILNTQLTVVLIIMAIILKTIYLPLNVISLNISFIYILRLYRHNGWPIVQTMLFKNFCVHCQRDSARLRSHEEISQHRIRNKEDKDKIGIRMICSECGRLFNSARSLAQHINRRDFFNIAHQKLLIITRTLSIPMRLSKFGIHQVKRPRGQHPQICTQDDERLQRTGSE